MEQCPIRSKLFREFRNFRGAQDSDILCLCIYIQIYRRRRRRRRSLPIHFFLDNNIVLTATADSTEFTVLTNSAFRGQLNATFDEEADGLLYCVVLFDATIEVSDDH